MSVNKNFILIYPDKNRINDLSIGSTETKYKKLNTKTQNSFCCVNENLMTFLYTLKGGHENRRSKKSFLFESVYKSHMLFFKKMGFST